MRRELFGFVPADEAAEAFASTVKMGECISVEAKRPRNIRMHRLFFGLMQIVFENQEHYKSVDHVLAAFKFAVGHTEKVKTRHGEIELPKSISFAKMDQTAFRTFFDRALDFLVTDVVPGLGKDTIRRRVEEMIQ